MSETESQLEKSRLLLETFLGAIELAAEKMARKIVDSKRGRKGTMEEELKENKELKEIRMMALLIREGMGLISEDERIHAIEKLRETQPSSEIFQDTQSVLPTPKS